MRRLDFEDMPSDYEPAAREILSAFQLGEVVILTGQGGSGLSRMARRALGFLGEDRPFRSPHHTVSLIGMRGRVRDGIRQEGELSLAKDGILYLEDAQELPRRILDEVAVAVRDGRVSHPTGTSWDYLDTPGAVILAVTYETASYSGAMAGVEGALQDRGVRYRVVTMPMYSDAAEYRRALGSKRCRSTADLLDSI